MLDEVSTEQVREFLANRWATPNSSTLNLERKILSVFFIRYVKSGHLKSNPAAGVSAFKKRQDEKKRIRRAFTLTEMKAVFAKCPDHFWRYLVMAGFYCGQRMGDLVCLSWGAVDLQENVLRLTQAKTGKTVEVPMRPTFRALLVEVRAMAGKVKPSDFLWPEHAERYQRRGAGPFSNEFYMRSSRRAVSSPLVRTSQRRRRRA